MSAEVTPQPPEQPPVEIGAYAPDFEARSTQGLFRLSHLRGRWVVFFSHPADFTPVCTSEFVALQAAMEKFQALGCDLVGLSVDSLYAHIAWAHDIAERFGVEITFPIVEDISMSVARAYGMVHGASSSTAAVRSVFVIDPGGRIRASLHYPMSVGRSVTELHRLVAALQVGDAAGAVTPEGWQPGEALLTPPPETLQAVSVARLSGVDKGEAWYCKPADKGTS